MTSNDNTINVKTKKKTIEQNDKIEFTYMLWYCSENIHLMSNDRPIYVVMKTQSSDQNDKTILNTLKIYFIINHTYLLLYCKKHILMMSNDNTIYVKTKKPNRMNKIAKLHSIYIEFTLQYITLTCYYIVKYTFRWWVMRAQ